MALLDAFDLDLATRAAGLTHQAPARRLAERPLIAENPYALCPYPLHRAIRSAVRDDDHNDARWTPADWHQAATRALAALGDQGTNAAALAPSRMLLVACLRQGLRLARDHHLTSLGWLIEAAFVYTDDSVWEPLALPAPHRSGPGHPRRCRGRPADRDCPPPARAPPAHRRPSHHRPGQRPAAR
ncbi:hypothetical protein [Streptomyces sp. NPDC006971]|uniref:hypothetical protein n=1 Tax=Streptomyces sp. NPDC006971 TaxID=3154784 RepID=UPI00340FF12D